VSAPVRRACIDIGSNTTRLLVADCEREQLREVHQERVFTRIGRAITTDGVIAPEKVAEVVDVVATQLQRAHQLGVREVSAVATAAIRRAANRDDLVAAIRASCGLRVEVLTGEDEARLAFLGAARRLGHAPGGELGVVDVGGGSSELVVGMPPDQIRWSASLGIGSGDLAQQCLHSDPPSRGELDEVRARVSEAMRELNVPRTTEAVAVGGSATSLRRLAGALLDDETFERSLKLLCSERSGKVASRFRLEVERVKLLPAGLVVLEAASKRFGAALQLGRGGVREGVLLEESK
jgi:exopolyphosphatase / guanosine-5'-triphosphate,3'-diphosphate pyrophosphatase